MTIQKSSPCKIENYHRQKNKLLTQTLPQATETLVISLSLSADCKIALKAFAHITRYE